MSARTRLGLSAKSCHALYAIVFNTLLAVVNERTKFDFKKEEQSQRKLSLVHSSDGDDDTHGKQKLMLHSCTVHVHSFNGNVLYDTFLYDKVCILCKRGFFRSGFQFLMKEEEIMLSCIIGST